MYVDTGKSLRGWLPWIGLLLLGMVLFGAMAGSLEPSLALLPSAQVGKTVDHLSVPPGHSPAPIYTVIFTNTTGSPVTLDIITDTLPAGFQFISMSPGSQVIVAPDDADEPAIVWRSSGLNPIVVPANGGTLKMMYAVYVPASVPPSTTAYPNTVVAKTGAGLVGPASAELLVGSPILTVTKAPSKTRLQPSQTVDYTVTFANSGQVAGRLNSITDTLDPRLIWEGVVLPGNEAGMPTVAGNVLTWDGPFDVAASANLVLKYQVRAPAGPGWSWPCNKVEADAADVTVTPAQSCVEVGPEKMRVYLPLALKNFEPARFTISKSVTPNEVVALAGQMVTYTVTIVNVGDEPGVLSAVADTLPAGFTFQSMVVAQSDVDDPPTGTTGPIRWDGTPFWPRQIAAGGQLRLVYRVEASQTLGTHVNQATAVVQAGIAPAGPASVAVTVKEGLLLEEHFENGIGDWTKFMNYWRLTEEQWYWGQAGGVDGSGAANHECCGNPNKQAEDAVLMYLEDNAESWTDYRMEVKLNVKSGDRACGVWVRGQFEYMDDGQGQWITGYYVVVGGKAGGSQHYIKITQLQTETDCWDNACNNPQNLYDFNNTHEMAVVEGLVGGFTRNAWHTLVVEVRGATIKAWLDRDPDTEAPDIEFTDPKEPFLTGAIGFKTMEAWLISFDDVYVWPLQ